MASARAGVVGAVEVNGPISNPPQTTLWDTQSAGTWAAIWFVAAVIILFFVV